MKKTFYDNVKIYLSSDKFKLNWKIKTSIANWSIYIVCALTKHSQNKFVTTWSSRKIEKFWWSFFVYHGKNSHSWDSLDRINCNDKIQKRAIFYEKVYYNFHDSFASFEMCSCITQACEFETIFLTNNPQSFYFYSHFAPTWLKL